MLVFGNVLAIIIVDKFVALNLPINSQYENRENNTD
jgi:hypothetical protein